MARKPPGVPTKKKHGAKKMTAAEARAQFKSKFGGKKGGK